MNEKSTSKKRTKTTSPGSWLAGACMTLAIAGILASGVAMTGPGVNPSAVTASAQSLALVRVAGVLEQTLPDFGSAGDCNSNGTDDDLENFMDPASGGDCNSDGTPDDCQEGFFEDCNLNQTNDCIEQFLGNDCDSDGTPDDCEADCNSNGTPDACERFGDPVSGGDCDSNGTPDDCEGGIIDCNSNGTPDCIDDVGDCDSDGTPDECETDCNSNRTPDDCEILLSKGTLDVDSDGTLDECEPDCNDNGSPDDFDIANGISFDCDNNGVPDECPTCPPVDIVFVMDTSGSMSDEGEALCDSISMVAGQLAAQGITTNVSLLGITEDAQDDSDFPCLTDKVETAVGDAVPGSSSCGPSLGNNEDWGAATAIVAAGFPWTPGAVRVIVPISDEGPCNGNSCNDPGDDRDAITNAVAIALANGVIVSPISGTGSDSCVLTLAADMAAGTGGIALESTDPNADIAESIRTIVLQACELFSDCNDNGTPDSCDIDSGFSQDCNTNGVPDECDIASGASNDCDGDGTPDECELALALAACPDDITIPATGPAGAEVTYPTPSTTGGCNVMVTVVPPSGSVLPIGTTQVTVTATDQLGGVASCTFNVTVTEQEGAGAGQAVPGLVGCIFFLFQSLFGFPLCGPCLVVGVMTSFAGLVGMKYHRRRRRRR